MIEFARLDWSMFSFFMIILAVAIIVTGLFMVVQGDSKRSYAKEFGWASTLLGFGILMFQFESGLLFLLGLVSIVGAGWIYFSIYSKRKSQSDSMY